MKILLSNDDGIASKPLQILRGLLSENHETLTIAPQFEQSGKSHSLTMHEPLRIVAHARNSFSISGTPADCVYVALNHMKFKPDMVISGINMGTNLGSDVFYSGTVAAAREGALSGIKSLAVSTLPLEKGLTNYEGIARFVEKIIPFCLESGARLLNLNVPMSESEPKLRLASLAKRLYEPNIDERVDPRGRKYLWICGPPIGYEGAEDCDVALFQDGFATLTPLLLNSTSHSQFEDIRRNFDSILCNDSSNGL